jgi:hypothetical protein
MKCKQDTADQVLPSKLFWCQTCLTSVEVIKPAERLRESRPVIREHREPQKFAFTDIFTAEKTDIF